MKNLFKAIFPVSFILFLAVVFSVKSSANFSHEPGEAIIAFDEIQYNFGKVQEGITLEHLYKFENKGTDKLKIESVQPSCGCTGASIGDKKEFEPGEKGDIKVTFNTQGREGVQSKTISIYTNDNKQKQIVLSFSCDVQKQN